MQQDDDLILFINRCSKCSKSFDQVRQSPQKIVHGLIWSHFQSKKLRLQQHFVGQRGPFELSDQRIPCLLWCRNILCSNQMQILIADHLPQNGKNACNFDFKLFHLLSSGLQWKCFSSETQPVTYSNLTNYASVMLRTPLPAPTELTVSLKNSVTY